MSTAACVLGAAAGSSIRRADRMAVLALFSCLLALYTLSFCGLPDNPDAEVEFQTTRSLVRSGEWALGDTPEARAIIVARFDVMPGTGTGAQRWYSWFGTGQALLAAPLYSLGNLLATLSPRVQQRHTQSEAYGVPRSEYWQHLAVGWRNPLLGAATAALLALLALRMGATRRAALLAALLYGLATFAWPQARSTLSDVQATFFLVLACERWSAWRADSCARVPALVGVGAALAACVLTRVALAPAVACAVFALALQMRSGRVPVRCWAALLLPLCLGGALFVGANLARFGSPLETGYGAALAEGTFFSYPPHWGLAGVLFSPGKGLMWMAPPLLLAAWGIPYAWRRGEQRWCWLSLAMALALLAPVVSTQTWHGAWTYGPRYALPLVAFLWPAVALGLDRARLNRPGRIATMALALLGLSTTLPGVLVDHMTHQDLVVQAARSAWPEPGGRDERERDAARFLSIQWSWQFAAPWAHWRILGQRVAGADEAFDAQALFGVSGLAPISPEHERERGWRHFAWVDLHQRLGGPAWIGPLLAALLLLAAAGAWRSARRSWNVPGAG